MAKGVKDRYLQAAGFGNIWAALQLQSKTCAATGIN